MTVGLALALAAQVGLAATPDRVCVDPRTGYPNVDFILTNKGNKAAEISEIRGILYDAGGAMIERRLIWQDSLRAVRPETEVPAGGTAIVFNPMRFNHAAPGRRMRFEMDLDARPEPLAVEVVPVDCAAGQPRLILPVQGRVLVYDGYDALSHHRRSDFRGGFADEMKITGNFQRFGMDLVVVDVEGRLWRGDGQKTSDWLGWGLPVRAAAEGIVASMHDGQPDNVKINSVDKWGGPDKASPMSSYGNYVLIDHGGGEFTLYGHMQEGSVLVKQGQRVSGRRPDRRDWKFGSVGRRAFALGTAPGPRPWSIRDRDPARLCQRGRAGRRRNPAFRRRARN